MRIYMLSGHSFPYLRCAITEIARRGKIAPIWRPAYAAHKACMPTIGKDCARRKCFPDMHHSIRVARGQIATIRRPRNGEKIAGVSGVDIYRFPCRNAPDARSEEHTS